MTDMHFATTKEDAAVLAKLADEIWREYYTPILGEEQVDYMLRTIQSEEAIYEAMQSGTEYCMVQAEGSYVGYMAYELTESTLHLSKFYLKSEYRGQGIGRELFERVKKIALDNGRPSLTLTVNRNNTDAIQTYRALGFHVLKEHVGDIGEGYVMDDYIMQYFLP